MHHLFCHGSNIKEVMLLPIGPFIPCLLLSWVARAEPLATIVCPLPMTPHSPIVAASSYCRQRWWALEPQQPTNSPSPSSSNLAPLDHKSRSKISDSKSSILSDSSCSSVILVSPMLFLCLHAANPWPPTLTTRLGASASDVVGVGEECGVIGNGGDGESTSAGSHHSLVAAGCATLGWRLGWGGPPVGFLVE